MLEDTSFAIHPGNEQQSKAVLYRDIGSMKSYKQLDTGYFFQCENGQVTIQFFTNSIIRVVMNQFNEPKLNGSYAVIASPEYVDVKDSDSEEQVVLKTDKLNVTIQKSPFRLTILDHDGNTFLEEGERGMAYRENGEVTAFKKMSEDDHFYGFGEKSGHLDKRGETYEMWNTDVYAPHNPETDPLYESIPYFMTLRNGRAHGLFFDNTFRTTFNMKADNNGYSFKAEGGQLDYYVLAGPEPKSVLQQYTHLTGKMPLPPKWALGYHQSRYSYKSEEEVRELASNFVEKDIPIDVIHLDIHYMNEYRVFTFDKEKFPDPAKLIADLREMGIRIVPIVDPGVKKDAEYTIYQEGITQNQFCKYIEGDVYIGDVWPGESAFPDLTEESVRNWWADKHEVYTSIGIEGIWNDMNEPAVFNDTKTMDVDVMHRNDGKPATHRELHNVYGLLMSKATYEGMEKQLNGKRPFLLTRAGFAGVQRYASVWTGDNRSFWEHLQMSLPMVMNLGVSGVPFAGPDVGGFAHDTSAELLVRWTQVGAFTPYFRNHSAMGTIYQEPWQFGEDNEAIMKKYIQMRYIWMPQLYSLFYQASVTGHPVMRPLFMEYPEDQKTYNINDQFMIGNNVVVAPILAPSVTDRAVYLPAGQWIDYETGVQYEGKRAHLIHAELDRMPIFIKQGTAIMQGEWTSNQNKNPHHVQMDVYAGANGETYNFTYYDDDGETFDFENGAFMELSIEVKSTTNAVVVTVSDQSGHYKPAYGKIHVNVHGLHDEQDVILNNNDNVAISLVK
ncbi:glycoside hydrolase family 31 protein [Virgibacillus litoralis]|uniref:Alpha-glucosidase n=1 Tax=Virgibacillus litoralis TaxID=578221 RepID=A0ABS4HAX2_9BACI|nr:glycoside hydrolase family 31 protein [Virgibacillus litoralis]MBP1948052.1 alpha-glucosidase [Virgibacillus litoralis]